MPWAAARRGWSPMGLPEPEQPSIVETGPSRRRPRRCPPGGPGLPPPRFRTGAAAPCLRATRAKRRRGAVPGAWPGPFRTTGPGLRARTPGPACPHRAERPGRAEGGRPLRAMRPQAPTALSPPVGPDGCVRPTATTRQRPFRTRPGTGLRAIRRPRGPPRASGRVPPGKGPRRRKFLMNTVAMDESQRCRPGRLCAILAHLKTTVNAGPARS